MKIYQVVIKCIYTHIYTLSIKHYIITAMFLLDKKTSFENYGD